MLTVTDKNFDWENIPLEDCIRGNCMDTFYTLKVYELMYADIEDSPMEGYYNEVLCPLNESFSEATFLGIPVDEYELKRLEVEIDEKIQEAKRTIYGTRNIRDDDNLNSTTDLARILYFRDPLGDLEVQEDSFNLVPPGLTPKGGPSTDANCVDFILDNVEKELLNRGEVLRTEATTEFM
jgi:DNA polymerase I-like protein with 3'-5' exonuclease and polymerase domains